VSLLMICLLPVGRICNLIWSSPEIPQLSKPTKIPAYARDHRPVKISYLGYGACGVWTCFGILSFC